jgi:DNA-binding transcriptional MocR family regulator
VIENDYDSEFRFEGRPLDPLQSLDRGGRVVYVGSFSKVMLPTFHVGFLVAPASLESALRRQNSSVIGMLSLRYRQHSRASSTRAYSRGISGRLHANMNGGMRT